MNVRIGKNGAIWAVLLSVISYYNILGSLMTDVDGGILPFLFLLSVFAYDKFNSVSQSAGSGENESHIKWRWFTLLIVALLAGFLFKLSFILVPGVIALDYIWNNRMDINVKNTLKFISTLVGFGALYVFILYVIQGIYPAFSIDLMLHHANQFKEAGGRNLVQIAVQAVKAVYYISPIVLLLAWVNREVFKKTLVFWIYLIVGLLFYLVIFDFSQGALDKYLMFIIIPICAIGGGVLAHVFNGQKIKYVLKNYRWVIVIGILIGAGIVALNFIPQTVVPLYPKTAWFVRVLHGHWNVLTPFNGGSGPMGFYISFLFIAVSYIISLIAIIFGRVKTNWRIGAVIILLIVAIAYNGVFAEEYIHGRINGSAPDVLNANLNFISQDPNIKQVVTYNDMGAGKLEHMGLYAGRFYAAPQFEEGHRVKFSGYVASSTNFMIIGVPPLYEGFYSDFFSKCDTLFSSQSGKIIGKTYSCKQQKP